jgi:hypothetical protein
MPAGAQSRANNALQPTLLRSARLRHSVGLPYGGLKETFMEWKPVTVSGNLGDDALRYQERAVRLAIEESKR